MAAIIEVRYRCWKIRFRTAPTLPESVGMSSITPENAFPLLHGSRLGDLMYKPMSGTDSGGDKLVMFPFRVQNLLWK